MPVILDERTAEDWMNRNETEPRRLKGLLVPASEEKLVITPASPLVNSVKNDGPELLDHQVGPGRQLRLI
jgi:putative SOS response-associated peptidase YedK